MHKIVFSKLGVRKYSFHGIRKIGKRKEHKDNFLRTFFHIKTPPLEYLVVVVGAKEDGDEGEPDDAGGVHREPDVLGLVEIFCQAKRDSRHQNQVPVICSVFQVVMIRTCPSEVWELSSLY
jgi:hypothetical protein